MTWKQHRDSYIIQTGTSSSQGTSPLTFQGTSINHSKLKQKANVGLHLCHYGDQETMFQEKINTFPNVGNKRIIVFLF